MPIATAKVSAAEMDAVPHHLIGDISPNKYITVVEYQKRCLQAISEIFHKPNCNGVVLVGGTNYYVESVIFDDSVKASMDVNDSESNIESSIERESTILSSNPESIHYIHPNNKRKIKKMLTENRVIFDAVYKEYFHLCN